MGTTRTLLVLAALLSGCAAASPPLYDWGNYESSIYVRYSSNDPAKAQQYLEEVIQTTASRNGRVPPGVYADYGMLLYQQGRSAQAIEYFQKEAAAFPEAAPLMTKLVERVGHQPAPAAGVTSTAGQPKASAPPTNAGAAGTGATSPQGNSTTAATSAGGGM